MGGAVIGKVYCVKFADDIALVADNAEDLQGMLRNLELYSNKNKLEVNSKKTKVVVLRKRGKLGRKVKWTNGLIKRKNYK